MSTELDFTQPSFSARLNVFMASMSSTETLNQKTFYWIIQVTSLYAILAFAKWT